MPIDELEAEAAMQFEAASPEKSHTNNINNNGSSAAAAESELATASSLPALAPAPSGQSSQDQPTPSSGFLAVNNGDAGSDSNKINNSSGAARNENGGSPADEPVPMDVDERVTKSES